MAAEMSADQQKESTTPTEEQGKSEPATLQVGGEDVKLDMPETREIDIHDRDPAHMNDHVKVKFADIIAEPDTEVFSFDKVWELAFKVFTNTKLWCYRITSVVLAIPLAVCWGINFACLSFCNIWCCLPCLKGQEIQLFCCRRSCQVCLNSLVAPCFEALGRVFSGIRVHTTRD